MSRTAGHKNSFARTQKEVQGDCQYLMTSLLNFPVYVEFKTRDIPPGTAYIRTVVKITEADLNEHLKSPRQPPPQLNLDQTREAIITRALNLSGTALSETRPHFHSPSLISEPLANGLITGQDPILTLPTGAKVWQLQSNS